MAQSLETRLTELSIERSCQHYDVILKDDKEKQVEPCTYTDYEVVQNHTYIKRRPPQPIDGTLSFSQFIDRVAALYSDLEAHVMADTYRCLLLDMVPKHLQGTIKWGPRHSTIPDNCWEGYASFIQVHDIKTRAVLGTYIVKDQSSVDVNTITGLSPNELKDYTQVRAWEQTHNEDAIYCSYYGIHSKIDINVDPHRRCCITDGDSGPTFYESVDRQYWSSALWPDVRLHLRFFGPPEGR